RLSKAGVSANLDALQIAATGVAWDTMNLPKRFQWAPLLVLLAERPERGLQAELVDDELSALADIARVAWLELLGRAAALQLTVDKVNLPENLRRTSVLAHDKAKPSACFRRLNTVHISRMDAVSMHVTDAVKSANFDGKIDDLNGFLRS
ncbi:MAG: hypothetical protein SGPRY_009923, partial [Prymnesium sp.]